VTFDLKEIKRDLKSSFSISLNLGHTLYQWSQTRGKSKICLKKYKAWPIFLVFLIRPARPCFESHAAGKSLWVSDPCCWFHQRFTSSFCGCRSQKHKKRWWLDCLLALLGPAHVKAACIYVGLIDPWFIPYLSGMLVGTSGSRRPEVQVLLSQIWIYFRSNQIVGMLSSFSSHHRWPGRLRGLRRRHLGRRVRWYGLWGRWQRGPSDRGNVCLKKFRQKGLNFVRHICLSMFSYSSQTYISGFNENNDID